MSRPATGCPPPWGPTSRSPSTAWSSSSSCSSSRKACRGHCGSCSPVSQPPPHATVPIRKKKALNEETRAGRPYHPRRPYPPDSNRLLQLQVASELERHANGVGERPADRLRPRHHPDQHPDRQPPAAHRPGGDRG